MMHATGDVLHQPGFEFFYGVDARCTPQVFLGFPFGLLLRLILVKHAGKKSKHE